MGDPKNGQSSRVRLYRITLMSWFRGDSIRGGTSAIPGEWTLARGTYLLWSPPPQVFHVPQQGSSISGALPTTPQSFPHQPPSFKKPPRVRGGKRKLISLPSTYPVCNPAFAKGLPRLYSSYGHCPSAPQHISWLPLPSP